MAPILTLIKNKYFFQGILFAISFASDFKDLPEGPFSKFWENLKIT